MPGSTVDQRGARQRTAPFEDFYEIGAGLLKDLPLSHTPVDITTRLDRLAQELAAQSGGVVGNRLA
ncbi:MAG: hypothetical protein IPN78_14610 [Candidatus Accumulibacter sp.]|nr:hypothetical protein [Candidatus Accumulibacter propinquus]